VEEEDPKEDLREDEKGSQEQEDPEEGRMRKGWSLPERKTLRRNLEALKMRVGVM